MGIIEILLIGVALSMDAAAVSMTNGMVYSKLSKAKFLLTALAFGFFQALMPALGYLAGSCFASIMEKFSGYIILIILGIIGGKMVKDGCCDCGEEGCPRKEFTYWLLLAQAIATSIDAFAVGVGFAATHANIALALPIIGITTFLLSLCALAIGRKFGDKLGPKAEILGGIILIIIGIKALF